MKAKYEAPTMEIIKIEMASLIAASLDRLENGRLKYDDIKELDDDIMSGNW